MRNKIFSILLVLFFLMCLVYFIVRLYQFATFCDGWIIADWLINYSAGFVRRGLCGSIILAVSDIFSIQPQFIAAFIQALLYIAYLSILLVILWRKKINAWYLVLLLSPITLLFTAYNTTGMGRKEILLYAIFSVYILYLDRKKVVSDFSIIVFTVALGIATLFHELIFFYSPYFIAAAWLKANSSGSKFNLR